MIFPKLWTPLLLCFCGKKIEFSINSAQRGRSVYGSNTGIAKAIVLWKISDMCSAVMVSAPLLCCRRGCCAFQEHSVCVQHTGGGSWVWPTAGGLLVSLCTLGHTSWPRSLFFLNRISLQNDQNVDVVELSASGVFFFLKLKVARYGGEPLTTRAS